MGRSFNQKMKVLIMFAALVAMLALSADAASSSSTASGSASGSAGKCSSYIGSKLDKLSNTGTSTCKSGTMCRYAYTKTGNTISIVQGCDLQNSCAKYKAKSGQCRSAKSPTATAEVYCSNNNIPYTKKKPYTSCPSTSSASSVAVLSLVSAVSVLAATIYQ